MKALVVEDTRASRLVVVKSLIELGIEACECKNGLDAVRCFVDERPDLVLLDIILPDIDGLEVARRIRSLEKAGEWTPIIFLTARTSDEDLEQGIAAGGDDYLIKPVSPVVIGAKIKAMQRIIQMRYSLLVLTRKLDEANQELKRLSAQDGLTGIANRRHFDESLAKEWRRCQRDHKPLSLILADVDHFKQFNDGYGHQAGDDCLREIAKSMKQQLDRASDLVARYGGEEFVVLLPGTDASGAERVADRLRESVAALEIMHAGSEHKRVTLSLGVATAMPDTSLEPATLVAAADRGLYRAKENGRNQLQKETAEEGC